MKTLIGIIENLKESEDLLVVDYNDIVSLILNDFDGFDEDGEEIEREYNKPELVEELFEVLDKFSTETSVGFYSTYVVNGVKFQVGYSSYDN